MAIKKVKTSSKMFTSDLNKLEQIVVRTIDRIDGIVGNSLGPGGRNVIIESDLSGIGNKNTKDGVTIFRALGSPDPNEHLIIEQTRDAAVRTVNEAGDGTTTATIIAAALIKRLFNFCNGNRRYSPQKVTREISKLVENQISKYIKKMSIQITPKNKKLLEQVATISANGDKEMAKAVMEAFDKVGFGASSHVTIQELSGQGGYGVDLVEGFPIERGYEESIGKFHPAFINDQGHQRCILEKPLFILFDGNITDMVQIMDLLNYIGEEYANGNSDYANVVLVAHKFSEKVLTNLAFNFPNPATINVVPLQTPMDQMVNFQLHFLMNLAAFTGAKVFDMQNQLCEATPEDLGKNMTKIEIYRFRTTLVGDADEVNIETRAEELQQYLKQAESKLEKVIIEEMLGKLTNGIARLKIFGSSTGELKEKADRAEDAVCSVRAAIKQGCLPGGGRILINLAIELQTEFEDNEMINSVFIPALYAPFFRLLVNAGYNSDEIHEILGKMIEDRDLVYDIENAKFGTAKSLGIYDATLAVEQAIKNAVSIANVMGTLGGIVCFPRDNQLEMMEFQKDQDFKRNIDNAENIKNEANERG